jgi:hypothetical protein
MPQFDPQDRPLEGLHPIIKAVQQMMILTVLPPIAQHADSLGILGVAGGHCSALAVSAKILSGIKTEAPDIPDVSEMVVRRLIGVRDGRLAKNKRDYSRIPMKPSPWWSANTAEAADSSVGIAAILRQRFTNWLFRESGCISGKLVGDLSPTY